MSRYSVEIFSSRITGKLSRGTLLYITIFPVSEVLWKRGGEGGREYQDFPSKFFVTSVEKICRGIL